MHRLDRQAPLQLRSTLPKRRKMVVTRRERFRPHAANEVWSLDFVSDQLSDGTRFRPLAVVDVFSREALAIDAGQRLRGEHVASALNHLSGQGGVPKYLFVDNGSELPGRLLDPWAYRSKAGIDFSGPGKPTGNCYVETFNGSLRDECLDVHWFESMDDARAIIEDR